MKIALVGVSLTLAVFLLATVPAAAQQPPAPAPQAAPAPAPQPAPGPPPPPVLEENKPEDGYLTLITLYVLAIIAIPLLLLMTDLVKAYSFARVTRESLI